jgi:hypothetical protein
MAGVVDDAALFAPIVRSELEENRKATLEVRESE